METIYTFYNNSLKALMLDTLFTMCQEDAKDAAAYVYAYDRLLQALVEKTDENGNF